MKRTYPAPGRRLERGQFSWVTLLVLLSVTAGAYMAWVWVPIYIVHYEVKQTVRDFANRAVKNPNDGFLVTGLCARLADLDGVSEVGRDGRKSWVPSVVVDPRDVTWERDTTASPPTLRVAVEYVRVVKYPWLDRSDEVTLQFEHFQDLAVPVWGNPR